MGRDSRGWLGESQRVREQLLEQGISASLESPHILCAN